MMADVDEVEWKTKPDYPEEEKVDPGPPEAPTNESWNYLELTEIKGIGHERAKDIGRIYKSEQELITALKENKVSLRNDIVRLLKVYYHINQEEE